MAEIHNAVKSALWSYSGGQGKFKPLKAIEFMPKKAKPVPTEQAIRKQLQKQASFLNRLAGF